MYHTDVSTIYKYDENSQFVNGFEVGIKIFSYLTFINFFKISNYVLQLARSKKLKFPRSNPMVLAIPGCWYLQIHKNKWINQYNRMKDLLLKTRYINLIVKCIQTYHMQTMHTKSEWIFYTQFSSHSFQIL